jgi:hypothetical protein
MDFEKTSWWGYLDDPMQDLMRESFTQLAYEKKTN